MTKNFGLLSLFFLGAFSLNAQVRPLGTWKSYMPYGSSVAICDAGDKVFSAGPQSVFSYDKQTGEIRLYDKSTGLSDLGIKAMNYDPATDVVAIAYTDNNMDLIYHETDIYNLPDIKSQNATGSISINDLSFYGGRCYVSSDIGISVIDLARKEIENTYIIGSSGQQVKVYATGINGDTIYAATQEGVKYAPLNAANLSDFNAWSLFGSSSGAPATSAKFIAAYRNHLYAVFSGNGSDTLAEYYNGVWSRLYADSSRVFTNLRQVGQALYFTVWNNKDTVLGMNGTIDSTGAISTYPTAGNARPIGWFESDGITWVGDSWNGLSKNNQGAIEYIAPDGPRTANVYDLNISDNGLTVSPGGADDLWYPIFNYDGFFIYNGEWTNYDMFNTPALANFPAINGSATIASRGKEYLASFLYGLAELDLNDHSIKIYNKDNSPLEQTLNTTYDTRISCVTADKYGNLWLANAGATKPIKVLKNDGTWGAFNVPYTTAVIKKILIDENDQLWMPLRYSGGGLLVWSDEGTINDPSDDKYRLLNQGAGLGGLPSADVYSIAEDLDGNMWVGTGAGIGIYYCASSILSANSCDADQVKVERDGYVGYLFGTEVVRAICVDAANRKWVGTNNGLWLVSADGKDELLKFTTDNSPLPTNVITDIAIDPKSGEVFIGTTGGLVSYQGDAIADCSDCESALVYPNPVKPDYDGPIAIKGLANNAYVKITDIKGRLIFQGKANGAQMIWDGKGYDGTRAKSGVYLVFSSTDQGKSKKVAKIVIAN